MNIFWYIWLTVIGLLCLWAYGYEIVGVLLRLLLRLHKKLEWRPEKDKMSPLPSFSIHTQKGLFGPDWGFGFMMDGRRFFYFHDYMGWHDLSEGHRRDKCDDPAYCPWHGSL